MHRVRPRMVQAQTAQVRKVQARRVQVRRMWLRQVRKAWVRRVQAWMAQVHKVQARRVQVRRMWARQVRRVQVCRAPSLRPGRRATPTVASQLSRPRWPRHGATGVPGPRTTRHGFRLRGLRAAVICAACNVVCQEGRRQRVKEEQERGPKPNDCRRNSEQEIRSL